MENCKESFVTIPLVEYEDLRDKLALKEAEGYFMVDYIQDPGSHMSHKIHRYYKTLPEEVKTNIHLAADVEIYKENYEYTKEKASSLNRKLNNIPMWIRKIFKAR